MKRILALPLIFMLAFTTVISVSAKFEASSININAPDTICGVDISSYCSLKNSGVIYKDFSGNALSDDEFFSFLKSNSINYIRIRIWNNPFDSNGNGYGGGNCDITNACKIAGFAAKHNIKIFADFHLSDFWADPSQQRAPKAWKSFSLLQKQTAVYDYVYQSLDMLKTAGADVGMVQVGNEINSGLCGETDYNNIALLLKSGFSAVSDADSSILKVVHFTDPQKQAFVWYADTLNKYGVDYDVFASSYYSYWHGTTDNFTSELKKVADKYGKYVMCAETSYPFTAEDSDFYANNVSGYEGTLSYPVSVAGQTQAIRDTFNAIKAVGEKGIGVFYWEPAWITVGTSSYNDNYSLWEQFGSGWESSYAEEYCEDGAKWHGGSSWDNQALFDKNGKALDSLKVFSEFSEKMNGDVDGDGRITILDAVCIQKHIAEIDFLTEEQLKVADVDNDSHINIMDVTMIQKIIAKII